MKFIRLNLASFVLLTVGHAAVGIDWSNDTSTGARWAMHCKFPGNPFANISSPGDQCASKCEKNIKCTHFEFTNDQGGSNGTCSLKSTEPPFIEDFESKVFFDSQSVCGYLQVIWNDSNIRPGHKGTHWATHCILSKGIDLEKDQPSKADECGPRCQFNSKCTHFTWLPTNQINEGRCFLKTDGASKEDAKFYAHAVCGIVERKPSISTTTPSSSEDCTCTCEA